ncbi:MAG: hypothetical protein ABI425_01320 [Patescibacteria group bacterium]
MPEKGRSNNGKDTKEYARLSKQRELYTQSYGTEIDLFTTVIIDRVEEGFEDYVLSREDKDAIKSLIVAWVQENRKGSSLKKYSQDDYKSTELRDELRGELQPFFPGKDASFFSKVISEIMTKYEKLATLEEQIETSPVVQKKPNKFVQEINIDEKIDAEEIYKLFLAFKARLLDPNRGAGDAASSQEKKRLESLLASQRTGLDALSTLFEDNNATWSSAAAGSKATIGIMQRLLASFRQELKRVKKSSDDNL